MMARCAFFFVLLVAVRPVVGQVRATDGTFPDRVVLEFDAVEGAVYYIVERALFGTEDFKVIKAQTIQTTVKDTQACPPKEGVPVKYRYRVTPVDGAGKKGKPVEDTGFAGSLIQA